MVCRFDHKAIVVQWLDLIYSYQNKDIPLLTFFAQADNFKYQRQI